MRVCPACRADYGGGEVFCPVDATRLVTTSQMSASPLDPDDPLIGTVLAGRYVIERRIGEGGMGLVYEGLHRDIDKRVAIKVLRDELSRRPEVVARFRQEAKSASRIGHDNIVDISDFGETTRGSSYFIMEYLDGEDLANVLGRDATVDPGRACEIVLQCCRALSATHAKGIVHRDIKPENIFLTTRDGVSDFVKIVDFGIAKMSDVELDGAPGRKLTKTGMIFGTPEYMSPEQAAGKDLDHRVDVYALGIILYECISGRVPFEGDTFMGVLTQHLFSELPPIREINPHAKLSTEVELVIRKALAKDRDQRYQDCDELAEAIEHAIEGRVSPITAQAPVEVKSESSLRYLDPVPRRRSPKLLWATAILGALGAVGWVALSSSQGPSEAPAPIVATAEPDTAESPPSNDALEAPAELLEPSPVLVHVATDPSGASLVFGDGTPGCDRTPCTLEALAGSTLLLRAKLGRRRGRLAITPTEEQTVLIELKAPKRAASAANTGGEPPKRRQPSRSRSSDLKVPEWAQ
jgi:serine/threonine-protein kinase